MNKNQVIIFIIILFCVSSTNAQNIKLSANPFHAPPSIAREIGIEFENKLNIGNSIGAGVSYYYMEPNKSGDGEYSGYKVQLIYRKYLKNKVAYKGLYISPSLNFLQTSIPEDDEPFVSLKNGERIGFGLGIKLGFQLIVAKNILLGFGIGPTYYSNQINKEFADNSFDSYKYNSTELELAFSVGWLIR